MTLNELIARIKTVASETGSVRPELLNTGVLIEVLLPRCLEVVLEAITKTPDGLQALRGQVTVAFTAGVGPLPAAIKNEYIELIVFKDDPACSYVSSWHEFSLHPEPGEVPIDYSRFHVNDGNIYYHKLDFQKNTFTGNQVLIAILQSTIPANIGDQVVVSETVLQKLIVLTASVVNGSIPLSQISLDYSSLERVSKRAL